jgi:hypothetical protein
MAVVAVLRPLLTRDAGHRAAIQGPVFGCRFPVGAIHDAVHLLGKETRLRQDANHRIEHSGQGQQGDLHQVVGDHLSREGPAYLGQVMRARQPTPGHAVLHEGRQSEQRHQRRIGEQQTFHLRH